MILAKHDGTSRPRQLKSSCKIDIDRVLPVLFRKLQSRGNAVDAACIDEAIQPPPARGDLPDRRLAGVSRCNVEWDCKGPAALLGQHVSTYLSLSLGDIPDGDSGATLTQLSRDLPAKATRAACHQYILFLDSKQRVAIGGHLNS